MSAVGLLAALTGGQRAENIAAAASVHRLHDLVELRYATEEAIHELGDEADLTYAERSIECEASVALSTTRTAVREKVTVGMQLVRLPAVDAAFTTGDLDYPRVRAIALTLKRSSDGTLAAIEDDVLAAARRLTPRGLREKIWALWISHNEAEATAARHQIESEERCADILRGDHGMSTLYAKMTTLEAAECDALLDEIAATVCPKDPRQPKELRGFALIALIHGEDSVACRCGLDTCAVAAADKHRTPRRTPLVQVMLDFETLLGLDNEPATLADGTTLDPETARLLATDARWQVILTECRNAAVDYAQTTSDTEAGNQTRADESQSDRDSTDANNGSHDKSDSYSDEDKSDRISDETNSELDDTDDTDDTDGDDDGEGNDRGDGSGSDDDRGDGSDGDGSGSDGSGSDGSGSDGSGGDGRVRWFV